MEFDMKSKVYIKTDTDGRIVSCDGGYTTPTNLTDWIEIDKGTGDKYNLCQSHYFPNGLCTQDGIYRYKYIDNIVLPRTQEEIEVDRKIILDKQNISLKLSALHSQLDSTDYKIIKAYECSLVGEDCPYDMTELHKERQALRDEINVLEKEMI